MSVLKKTSRAPNLSATQLQTVEGYSMEQTQLEIEKGKRAFLAGDPEAAISHLARANATQIVENRGDPAIAPGGAQLANVLPVAQTGPDKLRAQP